MKKLYATASATPIATHGAIKTKVYSTASIVTALSIAERGLGFLYRIVLSRFIGAEGLGLYQVALSVFAVFLTIGTGGIPISVSRLIAKSGKRGYEQNASGVTAAGITWSLVFTLPIVIFALCFQAPFARLFSDERCLPVFYILLIGLCFSCLYAVIRGSFWGKKEFLLPSILEIAEESVMVLAGVLLIRNASDPLSGAKLAAWSVVISYLFSFTLSLLCFCLCGGKLSSPKKYLKPLFNAALPITSVRASGTLVSSAIAVLLPVMLMRSGIENSQALALFGVASGMALPILMTPATVIGSIALVLMPELTQDYFNHNRARLFHNVTRGFSVAALVACFLLPLFYALGQDMGNVAFSNAFAGEMIYKCCILILPMSLSMISTSVLNAIGCEKQTLAFFLIGAAAMLACILFLPAVCGIYAYPIGMGINFLINAICNIAFLFHKCKGLLAYAKKRLLSLVSRALVCVLPLSLLGSGLRLLFNLFFGEIFAFAFTAVAIMLITLVLWQILKILPKNTFKTLFHRNRVSKNDKNGKKDNIF